MTGQRTIWGIHMGEHFGDDPVENGYLAIGWPEIGDPADVTGGRDGLKALLRQVYPDYSEGAVPVHAGTLYKWLHVMTPGDIVIYPSKHDRMVNIGTIEGPPSFEGGSDFPNRRPVRWAVHLPRNDFSQTALHEIGSAVTLFRVRRHAAEFLSKAGLYGGEATPPDMDVTDEEGVADDDIASASLSQQAEETTGDFIIRRIMGRLSPYEFEELVAHLLECLGYHSRVTAKSADGGVDVIAHTDPLGFQPPIVKVQCKRSTDQPPRAKVDQLLGTLGEGEVGLFITLGSYSRSAVEMERNRGKLRLIDGDEFVRMLLGQYPKLSPKFRSLLPLKRIYVPEPADT